MAAKKKTNIYDFVDDGTIFTYNRFAEDVLNYLYSMFGVQKRDIPPARCAENFYKNASTIFVVSRGIKLDQIFLRPFMFNVFTDSNAINLIGKDITNLYKYLSEIFIAVTDIFPKEMAFYDSMNKFNTSFALLVELTLFCIMKKKKSKIIKKMARTWVSFFENNLKKEFEDAGGISQVLLRGERLRYLDDTLFNFIPVHCVPYIGQELLDLLTEELKKSLRKVDADISMLLNSMSVLHLDGMTDSVEKTMEEEVDPLRSVPIHDRLGVPIHEEVLKRSFDPKILAPQLEAASTDTSDAVARLKFFSELSLERKKTIKLRLSKALGFQHKQSVAEVEA